MGNDLNSLAKISPFTFLGDYGIVYLTSGDVVRLGGVDAQETLVVTKVEIRFRTVLRNIALTVLIRIQRAWINVDVGIEFLDGDPKTSCLKKLCKRRGNNAFTEG